MKSEIIQPPSNPPGDFVPRGAMAFFLGMLLFFAVVWLGVYWLMLQRA